VTEHDPVRNADTAAEISQQEIPHRYKIAENKRHYATLGILKFADLSQLVRVGIPRHARDLGKAALRIAQILFNADADNLRAAYHVAHRR